MRLPWVKRATLLLAEERLRSVMESLDDAKGRAAYLQVQCDQLKQSLAESQTERHKLTDRILRMSGQPPLYEAAAVDPVGTAKASPDLKDLAKADLLPAAGVTFRGVHARVQEAMANGTFDIEKARPRR